MTRRSVLFVSLGSVALALACARGRAPAPGSAPSPGGTPSPARGDTVAPARPVLTDTAIVRDTISRAAAESLPPRPGAPPAPGAPANKRCVLDLENTPETRAFFRSDSGGRNAVTFLGGGMFGRCRGQDITIIADSAESYDASRLYILIGNVHYKEPTATIDAQRVTYFRAEERFVFEIDVRAEMRSSGGVMTGPRAEYFRKVQGVRDRERLMAFGRPTLTLTEKDSLGRPQPPVVMNANTIVGEGDSTFYGSGQVTIVRTDLTAVGDSVMMDGTKRFSRLMKGPSIESKGAKPYTLRGRVIDLYGASRAVDRVVAIDSASAVSTDLTLEADTIDLRVKANQLERAFAFGSRGAVAVSSSRKVIADSLDILMPNQRIRELHAVGTAYVETDPDTTRIISTERDWLRGDTVIAVFDSLPAADTARADTTTRQQMRSVVAKGRASAFYQMPPQRPDSAARSRPPRSAPSINYTRGRIIELALEKGEVQTVTVTDKASGVFLEPGTASDSAAARRGPVRSPPRRPPPGGAP